MRYLLIIPVGMAAYVFRKRIAVAVSNAAYDMGAGALYKIAEPYSG